jgi:hypothetical protein
VQDRLLVPICTAPLTSSGALTVVVPMPTLPDESIRILSVVFVEKASVLVAGTKAALFGGTA